MLSVNPFNPESLKWTLPSFKLDMSSVANMAVGMANSVDPDETAHGDSSHVYTYTVCRSVCSGLQ